MTASDAAASVELEEVGSPAGQSAAQAQEQPGTDDGPPAAADQAAGPGLPAPGPMESRLLFGTGTASLQLTDPTPTLRSSCSTRYAHSLTLRSWLRGGGGASGMPVVVVVVLVVVVVVCVCVCVCGGGGG